MGRQQVVCLSSEAGKPECLRTTSLDLESNTFLSYLDGFQEPREQEQRPGVGEMERIKALGKKGERNQYEQLTGSHSGDSDDSSSEDSSSEVRGLGGSASASASVSASASGEMAAEVKVKEEGKAERKEEKKEGGVTSPRLRFSSAGNGNGGQGGMWRESSYDFGQEQPFSESRVESTNAGALEGETPSKRRSKSFDFGVAQQDPTSRVIGEFLRRQKDSGELGLDYDLDMEELTLLPEWARTAPPVRTLSALPENVEKGGEGGVGPGQDPEASPPLEHRVDVPEYADPSFLSPSEMREAVAGKLQVGGGGAGASPVREMEAAGSIPRDGVVTPPAAQLSGEAVGVVKSPSRFSAVTRLKSRSRLADPPRPFSGDGMEKSGRKSVSVSGQLPPRGQVNGKSSAQPTKRSGLLGRVVEEDDDDPFKDADFPDKYRKRYKIGVWVFLQWAAFFVFIGALIGSLTIPAMRNRKGWGLALWKWCLVVLVVFCGRLISGWLIKFVVFFIERNFLLRKKVLYFVYGLRKGVQNCLWLAWVLLAWHLIIDPNVSVSSTDSKILSYVTKVLVCFLIAALLILLKTFLVKILASSFHVSHYFERIQESLFNQYILETLSGPPVLEIEEALDAEKKLMEEVAGLKRAGAVATGLPEVVAAGTNAASSQPFARSAGISRSRRLSTDPKKAGPVEETINISKLHKLNASNVSAWNMKRLINIVRQTGISTLAQTLDETVAEGDEKDQDITSEWQAKAAGKHIFKNVAKPGSKFIVEDDLLRFMGEAEAIRAFALFDGGVESGKITKQALKSWVINVYRERRALALSLNDTKTAVNKLHRIIDCIVAILVIIIWLLVLGIATTQLLVFLSSQLLLIVFVFGNTCKTIFEAIIFLFVMHPFDVGDRCVVDGVQMVVEEMNILTTVFLRYDNEKIWYPNSVLATKPISNYFRSPNMGDSIEFQIGASTPLESINLLKERVARHIKSLPHHWQEKHTIFVKEIVEMNKMNCILGLGHTMNHQDAGEKWRRRSDMLLELRRILQELGIDYRLLPQQVHLVNGPSQVVF